MDYDDIVVKQFKVDGIPAKFIIDKNNNIRFKSVGNTESADELVAELSLMIELCRNGKGAGIDKKGF
jgi:hypothetical protein